MWLENCVSYVLGMGSVTKDFGNWLRSIDFTLGDEEPGL